MTQIEFFAAKLQFEIDACDLRKAIYEDRTLYEIIDTRSEKAFRREHIEGAISLSYGSINVDTVRQLDKNKTFVTYCDGSGCNASTKGALKLSELGFRVKELIGGIESWKLEGNETSGKLSAEERNESVACGPECNCHN